VKHLYNLIGAGLSTALLAACGGSNTLTSSTPMSVAAQAAPLVGAPGAGLPQPPHLQTATGWAGSHLLRKNVDTESVIYSFAGGSDGSHPTNGNLTNLASTLYGTTETGGASDEGMVFASTTSGAESVLYAFKGFADGMDGSNPFAGLTNVGGTLYGTTIEGGGSNTGSIFMITTSGTYGQVYSFGNSGDGEYPVAGLTKVGSTLYGTTESGGANNFGTVFKIKCRRGSCTESVLHSFGSGSDGQDPLAGLTNVGGTLYGTTNNGGASNDGTVFAITTSGAESVLHSFAGGSDGAFPAYAGLTKVGSTLYGTTRQGGASNEGTVFAITTSGAESVIHSFAGGSDGLLPYGGELLKAGGTLYGATEYGGDLGCRSSGHGCGTIFSVSVKSGAEAVVYAFEGGSDGANPQAGLTNVGGTLYGTTYEGGANNLGTVFSLSL
jgi:uncharacterized repeat protein (TIGR03803 family)